MPIPQSCKAPKISLPDNLTDIRSFDVKSFLPLINASGIKVNSIQDLKKIMSNFLTTVSSLATVDLRRFIHLRTYKGKLRLQINCPIRRTDETFCKKDCIPIMSYIIKILDHKINLNHFTMPKKNICNFEFFKQRT